MGILKSGQITPGYNEMGLPGAVSAAHQNVGLNGPVASVGRQPGSFFNEPVFFEIDRSKMPADTTPVQGGTQAEKAQGIFEAEDATTKPIPTSAVKTVLLDTDWTGPAERQLIREEAAKQGIPVLETNRQGILARRAQMTRMDAASQASAAPTPNPAESYDAAQGSATPAAYQGPGTGLQIPKETTARAAIASNVAQQLQEAGVTSKLLDTLSKNPDGEKLFWDNISQRPGVSTQPHYSMSPATIQATKDALLDLERKGPAPAAQQVPQQVPAALAGNPKALEAARALQQEMLNPTPPAKAISISDLAKPKRAKVPKGSQ